jgi:hypothetical protein
MHAITASFPCQKGLFLSAVVAIRRDLRAFPEKFFFNLSLFTRGKMRETRPSARTVRAKLSVEGHADDDRIRLASQVLLGLFDAGSDLVSLE